MSWSTVGALSSTVVQCFAFSNNIMFIGTQQGVMLSTDMGSTWSLANTGQPYSVTALIVSGNTIYAGTQEGFYIGTF
jgi:hypothetical protein